MPRLEAAETTAAYAAAAAMTTVVMVDIREALVSPARSMISLCSHMSSGAELSSAEQMAKERR